MFHLPPRSLLLKVERLLGKRKGGDERRGESGEMENTGAGDTEVMFWFSLCGDEAAEQQPDPLRAGSGAKTEPFTAILVILNLLL